MGAGRGVTFPRVIELLKEEVNKTGQRATARATGVAQQAIHRFLKGESEPSQASLEKLAEYFKVSVPYLRGEIGYSRAVSVSGGDIFITFGGKQYAWDQVLDTQTIARLAAYFALPETERDAAGLLKEIEESWRNVLQHRADQTERNGFEEPDYDDKAGLS